MSSIADDTDYASSTAANLQEDSHAEAEHVDHSISRNLEPENSQARRQASVYDAVAGQIGPNGFLSIEQQSNESLKPLTPLEVILRRQGAPVEAIQVIYNSYMHQVQTLPDSELVTDVHRYAANFYHELYGDDGVDQQSMDETALLAMSILLEEASKTALGQTGDLVFTEAASTDTGLQVTSRQVLGKVKPENVVEYQSSSESEEEVQNLPRKRARRRYSEYLDV